MEEKIEIKKKSPFAKLNMKDDSILYEKNGRYTCESCKRKMKYFCYHCLSVVGMDRSEIPTVELPIKLDIIKHELELDGKSTALHAAIIAHKDVTIYNWKNMPNYECPERMLMLYPGDDALTLEEIPRDSFDRVIVIDGTWKQSKKIVRNTPLLQNMRKVTIAPRPTSFWRFQNISINYLSTIEAIYYLCLEHYCVYEAHGKEVYDGRYDNLLFYYKFFYDLIQYNYSKGALQNKQFCLRHRPDYIQLRKETNWVQDLEALENERKHSK
ncbi:DTW domain-containing protein [Pilobolus umbonatus]|nr:DTW domain-containing protein [Pilobolus umbonatus]